MTASVPAASAATEAAPRTVVLRMALLGWGTLVLRTTAPRGRFPGKPPACCEARRSCERGRDLEVAERGDHGLHHLRLVRVGDLLERLGVGHRQVGAGHAADRARRGGRTPAPGSARRGSRRRRRAASPPRRSRSGWSCAPTRGSCRGRAGAACAGRSPRPRSRARRRGCFAAFSAVTAMREMPTIVTSSPSRRIAAWPKSTVWSSSSGTSPRWPYRYSCSMKTTGLSSRIADLSSPLASAAVEGAATQQARHVQVQRLEAVRVGRPELVAGALRHADHHRHPHLPAEHVVDRRRVVDDLVHRQQREVDRHQLDHRAQAGHRRADAHPDDRVLGDRRVAHALLAELVEQPGGDLERAVEDADVLAHQERRSRRAASPRAAPG